MLCICCPFRLTLIHFSLLLHGSFGFSFLIFVARSPIPFVVRNCLYFIIYFCYNFLFSYFVFVSFQYKCALVPILSLTYVTTLLLFFVVVHRKRKYFGILCVALKVIRKQRNKSFYLNLNKYMEMI